jgi:hypothetical protein
VIPMRSRWSRTYLALFVALCAQLLLPEVTCRSVAEAAAPDRGSPMNPRWRVVLTGTAAKKLVEYCGAVGGVNGSWKPSASDLDTLERILAPLLAADLKSEGAPALQSSDYYRQYAAVRWDGHFLIYINGFQKEDPVPPHWKKEVIKVSGGGPGYWCAYYVKDTQKFAPIRDRNGPPRTVAFHGHTF